MIGYLVGGRGKALDGVCRVQIEPMRPEVENHRDTRRDTHGLADDVQVSFAASVVAEMKGYGSGRGGVIHQENRGYLRSRICGNGVENCACRRQLARRQFLWYEGRWCYC